jgi:anti-anti-sigma factor
MGFSATTQMSDGIAKMTLSGELDASAAAAFKTEVDKTVAQRPRRLALLAEGLDYIASAGLRVLIFAKQKLGADVDIYIVGAQPAVAETLEMTGFTYSVVLLKEYDAALIEAS